MTKRKLAKLRRELKKLRAGKYNLKSSDLTSFAKKVGRKPDTSRGKEPTYVSVIFSDLRPLSIPGHTAINPYTADSIMDTFDADLNKWASWLEKQEAKTNGESQKLPPATVRKDRDPH